MYLQNILLLTSDRSFLSYLYKAVSKNSREQILHQYYLEGHLLNNVQHIMTEVYNLIQLIDSEDAIKFSKLKYRKGKI